MEGIVAIFDFDKTIIDVDSDNWVVDELGFTELFNELLPTLPWNTLMDTLMKRMHEQGVTINQIAEVLTRIPIHPRVIPAIKAAHALGCDLRIVSDANTFFIEIILDHLGLRDYFSEFNTNPSYVDEEGRLRIHPHHDFTKSSHGCCNPCPPNMCKGEVIKRILSEVGNKKIIYLGDGSGDYCPSLKLRDGDHVLPRKDFPAWQLISANPSLIRAKIHEWSDGADLERVLLSTIQDILLTGDYNTMSTSQFLSVDCKLETMPMSSHELPKPLPGRPRHVCSAILHTQYPRTSSFGILPMKMPWESQGSRIMPISYLLRKQPAGLPVYH
ncbi:inorganic pyrophosphatase 2-like isoform X2 [Silene latifolia]|uniref:inorganic pyrophosphatase 2-like isoform X2 n=1 Tax=Silene latifolia TaxID=37657 RepID=UPI003D774C58